MEKFNEDVALLFGQAGPLNGQRWSLRGPIIVGREANCDIVVADRQVSRNHAKFTPTPNGIILEDLGSKNGTHRNGKPIYEAVLLEDGDIIQVALSQQFVYLSSDATVPLDISEIDHQGIRYESEDMHARPERTKSPTGRLRLDRHSRRVWIFAPKNITSTEDVLSNYNLIEILPPLSVYQFRLLDFLYEQQGRVAPRRELISAIWGEEQAVEVSEQALDALVRRLRDRMASVDPTHTYLVTVRGHGLRLDNPDMPE